MKYGICRIHPKDDGTWYSLNGKPWTFIDLNEAHQRAAQYNITFAPTIYEVREYP